MPSLVSIIAKKWIGKPCTLDGEPAHVGGATNDRCGRVILNSNGTSQPWPWLTINRTMLKRGGEFET
jgi:hypothetical protein